MRKKTLSLCSLLPVMLIILFMVNTLHAASVKDRMAARIPALTTLKDKGKIGEDNRGYLQYRSKDKPNQQLIKDENNDRNLVYKAIAKKQKVKADLVGQRRAKMIADKGRSGHLFQKSDGSWYKK